MAFLLDDIEDGRGARRLDAAAAACAPRNYFPYVLASHWAYPWPRHRVEAGARTGATRSLVGNGPLVLRARARTGAPGRQPPLARLRRQLGEVRIRSAEEASSRSGVAGRTTSCWLRPRRAEAGRGHGRRSGRRSSRPRSSAAPAAAAAGRARPPGDRPRDRPRGATGGDQRIDVAAGRGGLIPPAMPGHGATAAPPHDPERARALLAEAGHPGGAGLPELRLAVQPWRPGDALVEQLAAVGIPPACTCRPTSGGHEHGCDLFSSWHADYPDPTASSSACCASSLLARRGDRRAAGGRARLAAPGRAHAPVPRVRAALDRPARGAGAAVLRAAAGAAPPAVPG